MLLLFNVFFEKKKKAICCPYPEKGQGVDERDGGTGSLLHVIVSHCKHFGFYFKRDGKLL
jgi:hypothetical protein